jgi:hypothetical protein
LFIFDRAINEGKQCVVFAHAHVVTRLNASSSLPDQYGAGMNLLAAVPFYTQSL